METMVSLLRQSQIQYLKGYPSNLRTLAEYLKANSEYLPLSHVMTGSEPLLPAVRGLLRERFKCDVSDYYGNTERAAIAYECPHHSYHLVEAFTYVEVVDESGAPVPDGEEGELVGTCLTNYAMPLIRYRTGDRSRILREHCECGRELRTIAPVETKMEDCVVGRDGRIISPSSLTHPFKPIRPLAIEESQIVQVRDGEVEIRIVPGPEYSQDTSDQLVAGFHQRLGDSLEVHVHLVDVIERTPAGKLRWVIRQSEGDT
jgi:phenylacetate-CoA ligase